MPEIRWASRKDRAGVAPLFLASMAVEGAHPDPQAFVRSWRHSFTPGSTFRFVVAQDEDDRIIGALTLHTHYSTFRGARTTFIEDLFVQEAHRRRGVGGRLLDFVEAYAKDVGAARVELHVRNDNPAQRIYARRGFEGKPYRWMMKPLLFPAAVNPNVAEGF